MAQKLLEDRMRATERDVKEMKKELQRLPILEKKMEWLAEDLWEIHQVMTTVMRRWVAYPGKGRAESTMAGETNERQKQREQESVDLLEECQEGESRQRKTEGTDTLERGNDPDGWVFRASVPKLNLDDAFEQKNDIAKVVEDELEKAMSAYGFEIVQTLIVDIEPDEHVKGATNEINVAARLRVAANEKAEAEKILQIKQAEGEAEAKYLSGLGIARQRQAIVNGLRDSVLGFSVHVPGATALAGE